MYKHYIQFESQMDGIFYTKDKLTTESLEVANVLAGLRALKIMSSEKVDLDPMYYDHTLEMYNPRRQGINTTEVIRGR